MLLTDFINNAQSPGMAGVWRTTDGGATWALKAQADWALDVRMDQSNPQRVLLGGSRSIYNWGKGMPGQWGYGGFMYSTDGGAWWGLAWRACHGLPQGAICCGSASLAAQLPPQHAWGYLLTSGTLVAVCCPNVAVQPPPPLHTQVRPGRLTTATHSKPRSMLPSHTPQTPPSCGMPPLAWGCCWGLCHQGCRSGWRIRHACAWSSPAEATSSCGGRRSRRHFAVFYGGFFLWDSAQSSLTP